MLALLASLGLASPLRKVNNEDELARALLAAERAYGGGSPFREVHSSLQVRLMSEDDLEAVWKIEQLAHAAGMGGSIKEIEYMFSHWPLGSFVATDTTDAGEMVVGFAFSAPELHDDMPPSWENLEDPTYWTPWEAHQDYLRHNWQRVSVFYYDCAVHPDYQSHGLGKMLLFAMHEGAMSKWSSGAAPFGVPDADELAWPILGVAVCGAWKVWERLGFAEMAWDDLGKQMGEDGQARLASYDLNMEGNPDCKTHKFTDKSGQVHESVAMMLVWEGVAEWEEEEEEEEE